MSEPDFITETYFPEQIDTPEKFHAWTKQAYIDAEKVGVTFARLSVYPPMTTKPTKALIEGWKNKPKNRGPERWRKTNEK